MRLFDKSACRYLTKKEESELRNSPFPRTILNFTVHPTIEDLIKMRKREKEERKSAKENKDPAEFNND